ncbi:hypothetical protein EJ03DRAFT_332642 [Teratosphaeria nubilosa]|uniref:Uncharacterized protein n=1 Tax=Teratosphaeria nubilosa TaxID=161662 RepID=A0A6G1LNF9_9PEZI|nr:hypothetical protein EJ03DRAFT_332642 [Teratosphaeria nubilosa]
MMRSEKALRRKHARQAQISAASATTAQGPAAEPESRSGEGTQDGASTDQQQEDRKDRASTEQSQEDKKKKKRKKKKKTAKAEADEAEAGSPAAGGDAVVAAGLEEVEPSEESARHDSHQRCRDGSLADLIAGLEARFKALR